MSKIKVLYWEEIENGTLEDTIKELGRVTNDFIETQTKLINQIKERAGDGRN